MVILLAGVFGACTSGNVDTLKSENEALRKEVELQQRMAEQAAADAKMAQQLAEEAAAMARQAEAEAHAAMMEADKQRLVAQKALEDCTGK